MYIEGTVFITPAVGDGDRHAPGGWNDDLPGSRRQLPQGQRGQRPPRQLLQLHCSQTGKRSLLKSPYILGGEREGGGE